MSPIVRTLTILLVLVTAACTTPAQRAAEQQAREAEMQRLDDLGDFEECMMAAGQDRDKIAACSSLQPAPARSQ
jgi:hypothetical protein